MMQVLLDLRLAYLSVQVWRQTGDKLVQQHFVVGQTLDVGYGKAPDGAFLHMAHMQFEPGQHGHARLASAPSDASRISVDACTELCSAKLSLQCLNTPKVSKPMRLVLQIVQKRGFSVQVADPNKVSSPAIQVLHS